MTETYTRVRKGKKELVRKGRRREKYERDTKIFNTVGGAIGGAGLSALGGLATLALLKKTRSPNIRVRKPGRLLGIAALGSGAGAGAGYLDSRRVLGGSDTQENVKLARKEYEKGDPGLIEKTRRTGRARRR
jgi:hypothetical protein